MNAATLIKSLENHPVIKQIKAEEAARILQERKKVAARVTKAKEKGEKVLSDLQAKVNAAVTDLKAHEVERQALVIKCNEAGIALANETWQIEHEISTAEAELREGCDPSIDEAIQFFRDQWETARSQPLSSEHDIIGYYPAGGKKVDISSNHAAIVGAMAYCRDARDELEGMKLAAAVDVERIEALKKGLPDPHKQTKVAEAKRIPSAFRAM